MQKIYIAGPITGVEDYKTNFLEAELHLRNKGWDVFNPAQNQGHSYREYIDMGLLELMRCDTIYMLNGWQQSKGASLEFQYAVTTGMNIIFEKE